ncbi:transglycosylase SLT domain-containing protein [Chloracidobacterium validum]|uniref:Transglycosylase SLT domain-containing protein n=1 Tax=Chloracidobacterium validum TaxID=2821543 RepID=A0ABX8B7P3_9BACT|nr:transglycosylase SLT domain-containing protein [Chloracidobacterium validum]QUW02928.1 transglycosylase SLT domain-containing protein [Chloracidobacterium validum]
MPIAILEIQRFVASLFVFAATLTTDLRTPPAVQAATDATTSERSPRTPFEARVTAQRIQRAVEERRYAGALRDLAQFAEAAPQLYTVNNYDYLQARLLHQTGELPRAKAQYENVMQRPGGQMFTPYCLKYLAEIARREAQEGKSPTRAAEQRHLTQLVRDFGSHPAARNARLRLAESYAADGQLDRAIPLYRQLAPQSREYEARLGLLLRRAGNEAEAQAIFRRLLATGKDDAALLAAEQLDAQGDTDLSPAQRLARARLYLVNRHTEGAKRHFRVLIEQLPPVPSRPEALWSVGRAFFIEENWDEAIRWFDRAHEEYPTSPDGEKGYYQTGHALQNAGRYREAVARYAAFIAEYPNSEFLGGAHLNAIDTLRMAGDTKAALDWCDRTEKRFPRELAGVTARFQRVKILLSQSEFGAALGVLETLQQTPLNRRGPGSTNAAEVAFLRALCLERMGRLGEAVDAYLALPDTRTSYYGQLATERLLALVADTKARAVTAQRLATLTQRQDKDALHQALRLTADPLERQKLFNRLETLYQQRPAYARAWTYSAPELGRQVILTAEAAPATRKPVEEFCFLRLYDDALPFVDISEAFAQAAYAGRGDQAWKALAYGEPTLGTLPEDFRLEVMPRMVAELLYPAPYRDVLVEQARRRNVDPRLLLAIARQESRFNPGVKSPVGARGMFQFIDTTADRTAQKLNLTDVTRTDLYEPRFAIQLAAQYVAELFALFPAHPAAVAAAYNGGETATARWRARAGNDQARFAAEVGYAETKDYVFKVMTNYRAYRQLFDEDLRPRRA